MTNIYREELMEHYKNPQNRGKLQNPDIEVVEKNPMCGDIITMQAIVKGSKLEELMFDGEICAICVASASILTSENKEKTFAEAKAYSKDDLLRALGANLTTSRIKCATLPLEALHHLIEKAVAFNTLADKKKQVTILKTDKIEDVVFKYPVSAEVMMDYGLHCVGCIASGFDTIEKGAKLHEISDEEIDEMVERINETVNEKE